MTQENNTPAARQKRWRQKNRQKYLESCRDRYEDRRKRGVCNQCGRPAGDKSWCDECLAKKGER